MTRLLTDEEVLGGAAEVPAPGLLSDDEVLGFTLPAPPPSGTLEEVLKHASETFQRAVDQGVSLDEADAEITAEAEAEPAVPTKPGAAAPPIPFEQYLPPAIPEQFWGTEAEPERGPAENLLYFLDPRTAPERLVRIGKVLGLSTAQIGRRILEAAPRVAARGLMSGLELVTPAGAIREVRPETAEAVEQGVEDFLGNWVAMGMPEWAAGKIKEWEKEHPDWEPERIERLQELATNPHALIENIVGTSPFMAGAIGAAAVAGGGGAFIFSYAVEGESAYEQAMEEIPRLHPDWTPEQIKQAAEQHREVVGIVNGAIEAFASVEALKLITGKAGIAGKAVNYALGRLHKLWKTVPVGAITRRMTTLMAVEGLQEFSQNIVEEVSAAGVYAKEITGGLWGLLERSGIAGVIGALAALPIGVGGRLLARRAAPAAEPAPPAEPAVEPVAPPAPPPAAAPAVPAEAIAPEVPVAPPAPEVAPGVAPAPPVAPEVTVEPTVAAEEAVPEAPEVIEGEEVPFEVRVAEAPELLTPEQARVQSYLRDLSSPELVRALKRIPGPYGGTLAETLGVAKANKALAGAQKKLKTEEAAAKKALAETKSAYPDILVEAEAITAGEASLLGILGPRGRVTYRKGVEHGVETAEAIEGRSLAIRRHFTKAEGMTLEDLQMAWAEQRGIPAKDAPSLGETFGRLMGEIETFEAAKAEGRAPLEQQLRDLARAVPEEVSDELLVRVDRLSAATGAVWNAHDTLLKEATPFLVEERVEEVGELGKIRARIEKQKRDTTAELARARREIATFQKQRGQAVAVMASTARTLIKASGLSKTAQRRFLAQLSKIAAPEEMDPMMQAVYRMAETELKAGLARRIQGAATAIWKRRKEFDPKNIPEDKALLDEAKPSRVLTSEAIRDTSIDALAEQAGRLEDGLYDLEIRGKMLASLKDKTTDEVAGNIAEKLPPHRILPERAPGEPAGPPEEGRTRRALASALKPSRIMRYFFGEVGTPWLDEPGSDAWEVFYQSPVMVGDEVFAGEINARDAAWVQMVKEATGMDVGPKFVFRKERLRGEWKRSREFPTWMMELVQPPGFSAPVERRVLGTFLGQMRDPHTRAFEPTTGFNLSTDPAGPVTKLSEDEVLAVEAWAKENDPRLVKLVDALHAYYNRPGHLEKLSETMTLLKGRVVHRVTDWWYSPRNVAKKVEMPSYGTPRELGNASTLGSMKGRVPNPVSPLFLHPMDEAYRRRTKTDAGFIAYALPLRDANVVMNTPVEIRPGEPFPLVQVLQRRVGRRAVEVLQGNLVSIYDSIGMGAGNAQSRGVIDRLVRGALNNVAKGYTWLNHHMFFNQIAGTLMSWSDPLAPPTKYWRKGFARAAAHPGKASANVIENVPEVKQRHWGGGFVTSYAIGGRLNARYSTSQIWRFLQTTGEKYGAKPMMAGDLFGQAVRHETALAFLEEQGYKGDDLKKRASRLTAHLLSEHDFPTGFGHLSAIELEAKESAPKRVVTFFRITRGNIFSNATLLCDDTAQALRKGESVKPHLLRGAKLLVAIMVFAALKSFYRVLEWKDTDLEKEFIWQMLEGTFGHIPIAGLGVAGLRYGFGAPPYLDPLGDAIGAGKSLASAIEEMDPEQATRAAGKMVANLLLYATAPVAGVRNAWRTVSPAGKEPKKKQVIRGRVRGKVSRRTSAGRRGRSTRGGAKRGRTTTRR